MSLKNEFAKFGDASERERKLDVLTYQIEEIEKQTSKTAKKRNFWRNASVFAIWKNSFRIVGRKAHTRRL